jgi:hypothetical protein
MGAEIEVLEHTACAGRFGVCADRHNSLLSGSLGEEFASLQFRELFCITSDYVTSLAASNTHDRFGFVRLRQYPLARAGRRLLGGNMSWYCPERLRETLHAGMSRVMGTVAGALLGRIGAFERHKGRGSRYGPDSVSACETRC